MKKLKGLLSAFAVIAIVSSALAFKASNYLASGSVWCESTCTAGNQIAFKIDPTNGTTTNPCGGVVQEYIRDQNSVCQPTAVGTKFIATTDQSK